MGILSVRSEIENKELHENPYPWGLKYFKDGVANNWTVSEISMTDDKEQWNTPDGLKEEEREVVLKNLKFFGICESTTQDNISMSIYPYIQDGYVRMALTRQSFEEAIHSQSFLTIIDSLSINIADVYKGYENIPSINNKIKFLYRLFPSISGDFNIETKDDIGIFLRDLIGFYLILEGTFFFTNFSQLLSLRKQGKMKGLAKFVDYIMRDESVHINIGVDLINTIIKEEPYVWTSDFQQQIVDLFKEAIDLEDAYIDDTVKGKIIGVSNKSFKDYIRFIADRRLSSIGLPKVWNTKNPFPWMSTETDLPTETNFFESRPTEYSTGKIDMNDF